MYNSFCGGQERRSQADNSASRHAQIDDRLFSEESIEDADDLGQHRLIPIQRHYVMPHAQRQVSKQTRNMVGVFNTQLLPTNPSVDRLLRVTQKFEQQNEKEQIKEQLVHKHKLPVSKIAWKPSVVDKLVTRQAMSK